MRLIRRINRMDAVASCWRQQMEAAPDGIVWHKLQQVGVRVHGAACTSCWLACLRQQPSVLYAAWDGTMKEMTTEQYICKRKGMMQEKKIERSTKTAEKRCEGGCTWRRIGAELAAREQPQEVH